jgi:hypothetical protein
VNTRSKSGQAILIVSVALFASLVVLALIWEPKWQVASLQAVKGVELKDVLKAENDARATLAQILGGFTVLVGLYFAWANLKATQDAQQDTQKAQAETLKNQAETLRITNEGQITDRFTKAIDQLGAVKEDDKPNLEVRLGGIYALERIDRDSEKDHWPIMEILTAYVRENAPRISSENPSESSHAKPLGKDIQAVLTVVGRRLRTYGKGEDQSLNLNNVQLEGADLSDANLVGANLSDADLEGAHLRGTYLLILPPPSNAIGLTQEQLNSSFGNENTELPQGLVTPPSWREQQTLLTPQSKSS